MRGSNHAHWGYDFDSIHDYIAENYRRWLYESSVRLDAPVEAAEQYLVNAKIGEIVFNYLQTQVPRSTLTLNYGDGSGRQRQVLGWQDLERLGLVDRIVRRTQRLGGIGTVRRTPEPEVVFVPGDIQTSCDRAELAQLRSELLGIV